MGRMKGEEVAPDDHLGAPPPTPDDQLGAPMWDPQPNDDEKIILGHPARWRHEPAAEAFDVLRKAKNVFRTQESELVWVFTHPGTPTRFRALDPDTLAGVYVDLGVVFRRMTKDSSVEVPAPNALLKRVLTGCFPVQLPILGGIATGPYMVASGDVISEAGYSTESRLWLASSGVVPFKTGKGAAALRSHGFTQEEAAAGLAIIRADLDEFPYATREKDDPLYGLDESVAFAYGLTLLARPSCATVPFFLVDAPHSGSGKDLILKCFEVLAHGRYARRITLIGKDHEDRQEIASALATGSSHVVLSDLRSQTANNKTLISLLTEGPQYGIRKLGKNDEGILIPANLVFAATGHNVQFAEPDMYRRTLQCRLNPAIPNPEDRPKTRRNQDQLLAHFAASRPRYLAILFNVLRGYLHWLKSNPAPKLIPCDSFPAWGDLVPAALVWAGMADPMASLARMRAKGKTANGNAAIEQLIQAWWRRFGTMDLKCKTLYAAHDADPAQEGQEVANLRDALRNLQDKPLTERALGVIVTPHDEETFTVTDHDGRARYVKLHIVSYGGSNTYSLKRDDKNHPPERR